MTRYICLDRARQQIITKYIIYERMKLFIQIKFWIRYDALKRLSRLLFITFDLLGIVTHTHTLDPLLVWWLLLNNKHISAPVVWQIGCHSFDERYLQIEIDILFGWAYPNAEIKW